MTDPANDIFYQASQGSVAAIIQVLNEKLADSGVRTRAVLEGRVLQLLCEAETPEQLDETTLTERIKGILEAIAPQKIRRVYINSRIVREQQLLWLEEIRRDPKGQLLWAKEVSLKQLNPVQRWVREQTLRRANAPVKFPEASRQKKPPQRASWQSGLIGGAVGVLLLAGGWLVYNRVLAPTAPAETATPTTPAPTTASPEAAAVPTSGHNPTPATPNTAAQPGDAFVQAVRLAQSAVEAGQLAETSADWLKVAAQWQEASELMAQVPQTHQRYAEAAARVDDYRQNSEMALQRAQQ